MKRGEGWEKDRTKKDICVLRLPKGKDSGKRRPRLWISE